MFEEEAKSFTIKFENARTEATAKKAELRRLEKEVVQTKVETNQIEKHLREKTRELENEIVRKDREHKTGLEKEIKRLNPPISHINDWTPDSADSCGWHNCELHPVPIEKVDEPYILSFDIEPQLHTQWRAGVIFHTGNRRDPTIIFHLYNHHLLIRKSRMTVWGYWKYPLVTGEGKLTLNPAGMKEPIKRELSTMKIISRENLLILSVDGYAWRIPKTDLDLGQPYLAQWNDIEDESVQVFFKNIYTTLETDREQSLIDESCALTERFSDTAKSNLVVLDICDVIIGLFPREDVQLTKEHILKYLIKAGANLTHAERAFHLLWGQGRLIPQEKTETDERSRPFRLAEGELE